MILGIDGSLSSTGWCVHDGKTVIYADKIVTKNNPKLDKLTDEDNRVNNICLQLMSICRAYKINGISMEGQFVGAIQSKRTAMQLSRLRGAMMFAFNLQGANVKYRQPSEIKKLITGKGNATKEEVAQAIIDLYKDNPIVQSLGPFIDRTCKEKNSDIYDSIAIATAYYL